MKMKKVLFICIALIFTINLFAQNCDLSPEAKKHKIKAETFFNTATNNDDYQAAADEFEKVLQYAPDCSDIYFNCLYGISK